MFRPLLIACLMFACPAAHAWNAAGHRLAASIAWQQLSPATREFVAETLSRHADYPRWQGKASTDAPAAIFAEASTWPDDIRNDPRFYDEGLEAPTPSAPGLPDTARHKKWHYVDVDRGGEVVDGELERRINELSLLLHTNASAERMAWALPWLSHLVADIHQPLHVGRAEDRGGNGFEVENPFNKRLPFSSLHTYWDDLPGPPWLRGKRLAENTARLLERHPPPAPGNTRLWREESRQLVRSAYPDAAGSLLPMISEPFHQHARQIADRRLVDAGYRLGWLLEHGLARRVSRETQ
jgi:hypothetical protein